MRLMQINSNTKKQLVLFVAALAVFAGYFLVRIAPVRAKLDEVRKDNQRQQQILAEAADVQVRLNEARKKLEIVEKRIGNYSSKIPSSRAMGRLLERIADLMDENGLEDQMIRPGSEQQQGNLGRIPITMECRGSLEEVFDFYRSLEGLERLVRIESIELNNEDRHSGNIKMKTRASVYYEPTENEG
mgnify:CR=1 FL=1